MFSILSAQIVDAIVLDLFAGTGALGFEALSRGAARVTFVESHRPTADALRATARDLGVADRADIINLPAERAVRAVLGRYDVVFADPPYAQPYPGATFGTLRDRGSIDAESLVVYEHAAKSAPPADPVFPLQRSAIYGEVALAFLRPEALPTA